VAANSRVGDRDAALQATIYDWIESWKRHDLQRHVAIYAPVLDTYFTKHNVTRDQVYKDKKYSFWLYTRVHQYDLRDLRIQWRSANEAVATFRKKWDFSGRKRFSGDEIEALTLVRTGAGWQIKTEREVKVLHRYHS
jgi:UV DNA damage repair endonuclease